MKIKDIKKLIYNILKKNKNKKIIDIIDYQLKNL